MVTTGIGPGVQTQPDPYVLATLFGSFGAINRYNEYQTRVPQSLRLVPGERTKALLILGDSTTANTVPTPYVVTQGRNHTLNVCNGGGYLSADPMLGPSAVGGNACFATRLGDVMIFNGWAQRVVIENIGYGSTLVSDWAPGGPFNSDIGVACKRIAATGIPVNAVVWHAGPNDTAAGTTQANYAASLSAVIGTIRTFLPTPTPILIGFYSNNAAPNAGIVAAQHSVINHAGGVWEGVNMDAYSSTLFQAGGSGHPNDAGAIQFCNDLIVQLHAAGAI